MPYIPGPQRTKFASPLLELYGEIEDEGELNYVLTEIIHDYIGIPSYAKYNEVIGVLECAKLELYRRKVAGYEDVKIRENGDV